MAASARPDSMELADYLGVLRRRWWIVVLLVVVGAGAGAAYAKVAPKTYSASVLIEVTALPNNANSVSGRTGGNVNMDNEAQVATSTEVSAIAARTLHDGVSAQTLSKDITVAVPPNTTFLQVKCGMATAHDASACANAVGKAYLSQRRATVANGISSEVSAENRRITTLTSRVAVLKAKLNGLKGRPTTAHVRVQLALNQAQTQLVAAESDNAKLVPFLQDLNLPGSTLVGQIVTPATPPGSPSSPRTLLVLPSGLLAGLLLGLLAAFVLDFRDRRIHSARDVERFLDLPVLVDLAAGTSRMQPALAVPRSRTGQSFTELGQYVAASLGEGSHVVFVAGTSAGPGCSVLAANLAATLARTRSRVLIVCADPDGTVTPQLTGVASDRGLAEVLSGTATVAEVAQQSSGGARAPGHHARPGCLRRAAEPAVRGQPPAAERAAPRLPLRDRRGPVGRRGLHRLRAGRVRRRRPDGGRDHADHPAGCRRLPPAPGPAAHLGAGRRGAPGTGRQARPPAARRQLEPPGRSPAPLRAQIRAEARATGRVPLRPDLEGSGIQASGSRVIGISAGPPARLPGLLHGLPAARHPVVGLALAGVALTWHSVFRLAVLGLAVLGLSVPGLTAVGLPPAGVPFRAGGDQRPRGPRR